MKILLGCISICICFAFQQVAGYGVGDTVADFELTTKEQSPFRLEELGDVKGCIVVFTSSSCAFAQDYEGRILALDHKYKAQAYPVLYIDVQPSEGGSDLPVLLDPEQKVMRQFGATRLPQAYVLKKMAGRWVVKYIGAIDNSLDAPTEHYVQESVDALLQDRDIIRTRTVALGCSLRTKH